MKTVTMPFDQHEELMAQSELYKEKISELKQKLKTGATYFSLDFYDYGFLGGNLATNDELNISLMNKIRVMKQENFEYKKERSIRNEEHENEINDLIYKNNELKTDLENLKNRSFFKRLFNL